MTIRKPTAKRVGVFLALAISLGALLAPAGRAEAAGGLAWDDDGSTFAVFGANESVSIALGTVGFLCDGFFPTADVYVMAAPPGVGAPLSDVNGARNTVLGGTGGLFSDTIAFTAPTGSLVPGTYTVVYDECQDQRLDADDSVFPNAFEVRQATDVPQIDGAIIRLKRRAGTTATRYRALSAVIAGLEARQQLQEALACLTGPAACAVDAVTGAITDSIIEQIKLGLGLPTEDPKILAKDVLADTIGRYAGIEADPPDASFAVTTTLDAVPRLRPAGSDPRTLARFELANAHAQESAIAAALLHAIERYQGADIARAGAWARLHARQVRDLAGLLAGQLEVTRDALTSVRGAVAADAGDLDGMAAVAAAALSELSTHGLTADAQRRLINLGFSRAQIANAVAGLDGGDLGQVDRAGVLAAIDATTATTTELAGALAETRTGIDAVLAQLAGDPTVPDDAYPGADAGGPYAASAGARLTLAGAGPPAASAAWDLDRDGQFDDAAGLTPSTVFATAFDGLIGLRITDDRGHVAVDYARVRVGGDRPPSASFTPAGLMQQSAIPATTSFHVSASDPDGDGIDIAWRLDGDVVGTGAGFDFTPTAADAGLHVLEALVTDGTSTIEHRWALAAVLPDADGDGWRANLDCDDASTLRNPGLAEIGGNGVDDDCEALTVDDQPLVDANLLANPGAEVGAAVPGGALVPVPGWQTAGTSLTLVRYDDPRDGGFPRSTSPGPVDRGLQFFAGGPANAVSTASQTIDLARAASSIDAGQATFDLAAFIGGYQAQQDQGSVTATFLDASDASLAEAVIGPVTRADRGNLTGLLARATSGPVPPGSRKVRVVLRAQRFEGAFNDGYFDDLRLILHGPGFDAGAPVLEPAGDLVVPEGSSGSTTLRATAADAITLTAAGVPSFATFTDHGDGTGTLTASPTDDADAAVVVSACATDGCQRRLLRVRGVNVEPVASATANGPVAENGSARITASQADPGADTFAYAFDCDGDGSFAGFQAGGAIDCPFTVRGSHAVDVRVRDDDGGTGRAAAHVNVSPKIAPVADIARAGRVDEGAYVRLDGRGSTGTTEELPAFDWRQTSGPTVTLSSGTVTRPSFTAPDDGQYRFSLAVTSGQAVSAPDAVTVEVVNVAPQVTVSNDGPVDAGRPVRVTAQASDPGTADSFVYAFDCEGDGTFGPDAADPAAVCVFAAAGSHVVRARVTDDDGGAGQGQTTVRVDAGARSVVVADRSAFGGSGGVIRVDAATGARTTVSRNSSPTGSTAFVDPTSIAVERNGSLVVADPSAFGGTGGVIRVNPVTGARTTVSRNSSPTGAAAFADPTSIAVAADGSILVADPSAFGWSGGVIRVNPATGARATVSRNSSPTGSTAFVDPIDVAVERSGTILVADLSAFGGSGGVIRVNPVTGARTTVSRNTSPAGATAFVDPSSLVVEADGSVVVADLTAFGGSGGVIRVNALTGARTTVSRNTSPIGTTAFLEPIGVAVEANGGILVSDTDAFGGSGGVIRVNPVAGARTTLSANAGPVGTTAFVDPTGLVVESAP
jgi:hypothetical protein